MNFIVTKVLPNAELMAIKLRAFIKLTRWREHLPHTIGLALCGALMAVHLTQSALDWRLLAVVLANVLAQSFAFIINDVEDAPDDALNDRKKAHNAISNEEITRREGMWFSGLMALASLALFAVGGLWTFLFGGLMIALCYLYSAYPFRLKARPLTDVLSHALMLSALIVITGYFTYHDAPGLAWLVILAAFLFSAYGQFYNQIDDYEVDKKAGLQNTVVLLGKRGTQILMYSSLIGAAVFVTIAAISGAFPAWLGLVGIIGIAVSAMFSWETDMRGNPAEGSGSIQKPALLIMNLMMAIWLAHNLGVFNI